ncbi:hypothetical protein BEH_07300 [Priestia filamentosa]|jgi:YonK protein|uniref:Bacillus phage SPbeta YonK domain-containing protein n=1 Tax=Priestia filamentosa TaxID=1402861 RepID=A0A0H4KUE8_9BACI|nr:YonK family protein [Priestia filamentosa]AKO91923.1 hypothetical protein BEH_07300 [Priestia filamentosa]
MAKNQDTMSSNLTGVLDVEEMTVTFIDKKDEGETVYDLEKTLQKYNGHTVSITFKVDENIDPVEE